MEGVGGNIATDDHWVFVYRGTDKVAESSIYDETGHILSDAAKSAYMENNNL